MGDTHFPENCKFCGSNELYGYEEVVNLIKDGEIVREVNTNGTQRIVCKNCEREL